MILQEIHARGGRKFGFMNLPPFGCFPGIKVNTINGSCLKEGLHFAKLHNTALSELLMKLGKELEGFKYSLYDLNTNLRKRINHPSKYGKLIIILLTECLLLLVHMDSLSLS